MVNKYLNIDTEDLSNWNRVGFILRSWHLKNYLKDLTIIPIRTFKNDIIVLLNNK